MADSNSILGAETNEENDLSRWIFVYGTLKPGYTEFSWNQEIHNDHFSLTCEPAILHDYTLCMHNGYVTIIEAKGKQVKGFALTSTKRKELLVQCDIIEEVPQFYLRIPVCVILDKDGSKLDSYVYHINPNKYLQQELIPIGEEFFHTTTKQFS